jgi:hypothetical protein
MMMKIFKILLFFKYFIFIFSFKIKEEMRNRNTQIKVKQQDGGGLFRYTMTKNRGAKGIFDKGWSKRNPFRSTRKFDLGGQSKVKLRSGAIKFRYKDAVTGRKMSTKLKMENGFAQELKDAQDKGQLKEKLKELENKVRSGESLDKLKRVSTKTYGSKRFGIVGRRGVTSKVNYSQVDGQDVQHNVKTKVGNRYLTTTNKYDDSGKLIGVETSVRRKYQPITKTYKTTIKYRKDADGNIMMDTQGKPIKLSTETRRKGVFGQSTGKTSKVTYGEDGKVTGFTERSKGVTNIKRQQEAEAKYAEMLGKGGLRDQDGKFVKGFEKNLEKKLMEKHGLSQAQAKKQVKKFKDNDKMLTEVTESPHQIGTRRLLNKKKYQKKGFNQASDQQHNTITDYDEQRIKAQKGEVKSTKKMGENQTPGDTKPAANSTGTTSVAANSKGTTSVAAANSTGTTSVAAANSTGTTSVAAANSTGTPPAGVTLTDELHGVFNAGGGGHIKPLKKHVKKSHKKRKYLQKRKL